MTMLTVTMASHDKRQNEEINRIKIIQSKTREIFIRFVVANMALNKINLKKAKKNSKTTNKNKTGGVNVFISLSV